MELVETCLSAGPGRRADYTVLERELRFSQAEIEALAANWALVPERLATLLEPFDVASPVLEDSAPTSWPAAFCRLYGELALALQRRGGHRVAGLEVRQRQEALSARLIFEFEDREVGDRAGALGLALLVQACPGLSAEVEEAEGDLAGHIADFLASARERVLPLDTQAIMEAAQRADIPCAKLDRYPFESRPGDRRIRPNGGLRLGQCRHQLMVDGTFCVSRAGAASGLVNNGPAGLALLAQMGLPVPAGGSLPPGRLYGVLLGNRQRLFLFELGPDVSHLEDLSERCPPALLAQIDRVAAALDVGLVLLTLVSQDLEGGEACFVDLDVAPRLDVVLASNAPMLERAAEAFVAWLFPPGASATVPIVAVTATNGKTTTSNLVHWLLRQAGRQVGLADSDGLYDANRRMLQDGDQSGIYGHSLILSDPQFDSLVLETAHGGIAVGGFAYDACEVGVCINVTRDHLYQFDIESVEEMAAIKRMVPARARRAVVINADDPMACAMLPFPDARDTCLVSIESAIDDLRALPGAGQLFALLEAPVGQAELVLYEGERRIPLIALEQLPMALGGGVHYNITNALHGAAAAYLMGVAPEQLARGLPSFHLGTEMTPGRLNFYHDLPFRVVLDYAHNPDGLTQLSAVLARLPVAGRRYVTLSAAAYQDEQTLRENARAVAGKFDVYYCFNYRGDFNKGHSLVAGKIAECLRQEGVAAECIVEVPTEMEATRELLARGQPGDLLAILPGKTTREEVWQIITQWPEDGAG